MSVLDEFVLYHLHHAKSRLDRPDNHNRGSRDHQNDSIRSVSHTGLESSTAPPQLPVM